MTVTTPPRSLRLPRAPSRGAVAGARAWLDRPVVVLAGLALLTLLAAYLRRREIGAALWLDEAQAVNIAHRSLGDIPDALRVDGSPPLYYVVLHAWMAVIGDSEVRVHALSAAFAALCVPAGWAAARLAAGPLAAWLAAGLLAVNPYLTAYAGQARMYTLLALLALVVVACLLAAYVHRRRIAVPAFGVALALALYTHNWAFFLAAGCGAAGLALWLLQGRDRRLLVDLVLGFGLAGLLFLPWVPVLLDQIEHTGAPWSVHPTSRAISSALQKALGGLAQTAVLLLVTGFGLAEALRRTRGRPRLGAVAVLVVPVATLAIAVAFSQVTLAWAPRYLAVVVGPLVVLAAVGLAAGRRSLGIAAAVLVALLSLGVPSDKDLRRKTNVHMLTRALSGPMERGDLVVSTQPEQIPALARYLRPGLRYATPYGLVDDPDIMNWRDALPKLRGARAEKDLQPLVDRLRPGQHVLLVNAVTAPQGFRSEWARLVRERKVQWKDALGADPRIEPVEAYSRLKKASFSAASGTLFVVRRPGARAAE